MFFIRKTTIFVSFNESLNWEYKGWGGRVSIWNFTHLQLRSLWEIWGYFAPQQEQK